MIFRSLKNPFEEEEKVHQELSPPLDSPSVAQEPAPIYPEKKETVLGKNVEVEGTLTFTEALKIDGRFQGKILCNQGKLHIGPQGSVEADLNALTDLLVEGQLKGDVHISGHCALCKGAKIEGNVTAHSMSIEEGATIMGQLCIDPHGA